MPVDPHIAAVLTMMEQAGMPPMYEGSAEAGRAQYLALTHGSRAPEQVVQVGGQGALQGGIGSMNSVAQIIGPLLASQSLAAGASRGFPGSAFLVAAALTAGALLVIAFRLPHLRATEEPAGEAS